MFTQKHVVPTIENLKQEQKPIVNANTYHYENFSTLEKVAVFVTERVGTMGFFIIIFVWTFGWLGWNIVAPFGMRFDPYPAFVLWLFISNMIQIMLMPLIMVGQNLQGRHAEARAEAEFNMSANSEKTLDAVLKHLENQNAVLDEIHSHVRK